MDKGEAEEYLKKLQNLEKNINSDDDEDDIDLNFIGELNELLTKLDQEFKTD